MKKKTILLLFLLILSIYSLNINVQITAEENDYRPSSLELIPHDSIFIDSDSGFLAFPGLGTVENPYVIDGYSITTTSSKGICIKRTTKYFTIRNCYVEAEGYGISIYQVADGTVTIINNTCSNNGAYGIYIHYSFYILIHHNTFVDNNLGGSDRGFSQAYDKGGKNTWYDPETKEGNYWSDLGDDCKYKIDGDANSKDLYPLNRAQSCPNPVTITILSIFLPLLVSVAILAFVVPKYAVPYTKNTVIPNYRKRKTERSLRLAKMSEEEIKEWKKRKRKLIIWSVITAAGFLGFIPSLLGFIEQYPGLGIIYYMPPLIIFSLMVFFSSIVLLIVLIRRPRKFRSSQKKV